MPPPLNSLWLQATPSCPLFCERTGLFSHFCRLHVCELSRWKSRRATVLRIVMRRYGVSSVPRVAWYVSHSLAVRRADAARRRTRGAGSAPIPMRPCRIADASTRTWPFFSGRTSQRRGRPSPLPLIATDRC